MRYLFSLILFIWGAAIAHADVLPIQSFKTPKGLEVWLVEDKSSPIVSLVITFSQTEMHSPLEPISILLGAAINDGSGIMTPLELEREANSLPFKGSIYMGITKDSLHLKTTKTGLPATLKLWSRLVGSPQFHEKGLERSRVQANSTVSFLDENLSDIAYFNLLHAVFKDPLFQLALDKAPKIINSLPSSDLKKRASLHFLQKRPHIVAVGNTTQKELSTLLDSTFGALPLVSASSSSSPKPHWKANTIFLTRDVSQATIALGHPGVDPQSKDYPQFLLLEYILNQRFYEEIREKYISLRNQIIR